MIYRLDKADYSSMRITKKEEGTIVKKKYYDGATNRISVAGSRRIKGAYETGLKPETLRELEIELGYDENMLAPKSSYWLDFGIKVEAGGITLNDENPEDKLKILILKAREDVAQSTHEAKTKKGIVWLLYTEEAEAKVTVNSMSHKVEAFSLYSSMSIEDMTNYLKAQNINVRTMSDEVIRGRVGMDADTKPKQFVVLAKDKHQATKIFINDLVGNAIIKMKGASYLSDEEIPMANNLEEMVGFILDKSNAKTIVGWKKLLEEVKSNR